MMSTAKEASVSARRGVGRARTLLAQVAHAKLATPNSSIAISNPSGLRKRILPSRLCNTAGRNAIDSASVQEPTHAEVTGVLHTGRVQFRYGYEGPFCSIACHAQQIIDSVSGTEAERTIIMDEQSAVGRHNWPIVSVVLFPQTFGLRSESEIPPPCGGCL